MDLRTAVAASLLPGWRPTLAAAFKDLCHGRDSGRAFLDRLWSATRRDPEPDPRTVADALESADRALAQASRLGLTVVPLTDSRYPALLTCTADPPPVLWVRGGVGGLGCPAVAVVGSRAATPYALQVATRLGAELAGRGILVVSGLARGVDSAAHRGCLEAGGRTAAVLGCGLDRVYPAEHTNLSAAVVAQDGVLLSELPPGTPPLPRHFPLRNRIISGISLATVVVEASEQSGSLITARCALEQGRDVMAVPGSVLSGRNRGSHALLKDGARIVETADDILQELGWSSAVGPQPSPRKPPVSDPLLGRMAPGEPYALDELAAATGTPGARLLARLAELELSGCITVTGGRFVRTR